MATSAANEVALGGEGSSVRIGDIATSTATQTGPVSMATVDENGTMGRNSTIIPALQAGQTALAGQVSSLFDLRDQDVRDTRQGIAAAIAMGTPAMPSAPGRVSYVLNAATFRGEQAVGGAFMYRLKNEKPFAVTAGFAHAGNKNTAAKVGIAGEF